MNADLLDKALRKLYNAVNSETLDAVPVEDMASIVRLVADIDETHQSDVEKRIEEIREYRAHLARLKAIPLIAQRSEEWYNLRKQRLTASDTAQAIGKGKFGSRDNLVQKKVLEMQGKSAPFRTMPAMKWGVMFEQMAMRCYQQENDGVNVYEFGLIPHPTLSCYGASPDGITELGIMTEIKCPYRRKITGEVPDYYELQMQGQMAVCGLRECDYIECDMQVFDNEEAYVDAQGDLTKDHGVICEFTRNGETMYEYSDPHLTARQAVAWARESSTRKMRQDELLTLVKLHMWSLRHMSVKRVYFDQERWDKLVPELESFWNDVVKGASTPVSATSSSKCLTDKKKHSYTFIQDDSD
jgi:putative phage-type endonuclease